MKENKVSKSRRNALLSLIQKARNSMSRLLNAKKQVEDDPHLVVEERNGLLFICEAKSDHIYRQMKK